MCIDKDSLLISVFKILPEEIDFYIQAPSLEDDIILNMMSETEYPYYKLIKVNKLNKNNIIKLINVRDIIQYFQHIELRNNNEILFQGFDGVEFGIISKLIRIPEWFSVNFINTGECSLSNDW